jgi:hypothetical protein
VLAFFLLSFIHFAIASLYRSRKAKAWEKSAVERRFLAKKGALKAKRRDPSSVGGSFLPGPVQSG